MTLLKSDRVLRLILCINFALGLWIPFERLSFRSPVAKILSHVYEKSVVLVFLTAAAGSFIAQLGEGVSLRALGRLAAFSSGHIAVSLKSIFIMSRKNQLLDLFSALEKLISNPHFKPMQNKAVRAAGRRARKILLTQAMVFVIVQICVFALSFKATTQNKKFGSTSGMMSEAIGSSHKGNLFYFVLLTGCLTPFKSMSLDSLVFFFYSLISIEVLILKSTLQSVLWPRKIKVFATKKITCPEMKEWLEFRRMVANLADKTNDFFAPVMSLVISMSTMAIFSHTFTAANYATSMTIVFILFLYVLWVGTQIFCYCMVGQKLRNCCDDLNKEICRQSWLENFSNRYDLLEIIPLLQMTCADSLQSFSVKISTLITFHYEFFASIVSFVATYFFVLYQFSDD